MKYERYSDNPGVEIAIHPPLYFGHGLRLKIDTRGGRIVVTGINHDGRAVMDGIDITDLVRC